MPRLSLYIDRVDDSSDPGSPRFLITGNASDGAKGGFQVLTFDPWRASMCQRARDMGVAIELIWKDGRYGKEIVAVSLLESKASGDPITVGDRADLCIGRNQLTNEDEFIHVECVEIFHAPDGIRRVRFKPIGGGKTNVPRWERWPTLVRDLERIAGLINVGTLVLQSQLQEVQVRR